MKICKICKQNKELNQFYKSKRHIDKLFKECKSCIKQKIEYLKPYQKEYGKKYRELHSEIYKESRSKDYIKNARQRSLKKLYGMTIDQYHIMINEQNNLCAICELETKIRLSVDHCHKTGKIRGLLCNSCNLAIGKFKDDPNLLIKAAQYLRKNI